ncbi:MAG: hypothetical protein WDZ30_11720, partial [Cellvibrionaceae bacterium]
PPPAPGKATPSLFDRPKTDDSAPAINNNTRAPQQHVEQPAEQQPSLFDPDHDDSVAGPTSDAPMKPVAKQTPTPAGNQPAARRAPATSGNKTENPFLPKHIRDRLAASRALQQSPDYPRPATKAEGLDHSDAEFAEQIVEEYLPKVEAELRKKIRALIRAEREITEKSS